MSDMSNPFDGLLGDLLKIIGGQGGSTPWLDSAKALAVSVASGEVPEGNVDPLERMAFEQLAPVVTLHVAELIGSPLAPVEVEPITRAAWALAQLEAWTPMVEQVVAAQSAATGQSMAQFSEEGDGHVPPIMGQFAAILGPMMLGLQFGSAAGHLAERALGSYALPLPWPAQSPAYVVPANVASFANDWSLPLDEVRLFVVTREIAGAVSLGTPSIAARVTQLLQSAMTEALANQASIIERLSGSGDPEALQAMLSDPESILAELVVPAASTSSATLTAATTALAAFLDHIASTVTARLTTSHVLLNEAWRRHRTSDAKGEQSAGSLFGLDLSSGEVDRGAKFVAGVLERAGNEGLAKLVSTGVNLPTPAELDAPGLWLERIALPEIGL
jgi:putative hydrolase